MKSWQAATAGMFHVVTLIGQITQLESEFATATASRRDVETG